LLQLGLRNINNPMHVERNFLGIGHPVFVAEAIDIFAICLRREGVVRRRRGIFIPYPLSGGIFDLNCKEISTKRL
jgi:hypothetical protein